MQRMRHLRLLKLGGLSAWVPTTRRAFLVVRVVRQWFWETSTRNVVDLTSRAKSATKQNRGQPL